MLRDAVILAGGLATRLGGAASSVPKVLQPVAERPFIEHTIWNLRRHGVTRFVLAVGHLHAEVEHALGDGGRLGVEIVYSREESPLGTGGALKRALRLCGSGVALALNGDTLFDFNYLDLVAAHSRSDAQITMALRDVSDSGRYGSVTLTGDKVTGFAEKSGEGTLVNGGVYAISTTALDRFSDGPFSLEVDAIPALVEEGAVGGRVYDGPFIDIGTPASLELARSFVTDWRDKPALMLDRDGVLNVDRGWVHSVEEWEWMPGAIEAIRQANNAGWLVIVVTNQAGIGRGLYTEADFHKIMAWMSEQLASHGAHIDAYYFCPHHPTEAHGPYLQACGCRKPAPGMLQAALRDWGIRPERAVLVGDSETDMVAAAAAGVHGVRYGGGDVAHVVLRAMEAVA